MELQAYLEEVSVLPGLSGNEQAVAEYVKKRFEPLCDEVNVDCMYNVIAHKKGKGPKVMLAAHMDEIGLMVVNIEEDGCIRIGNVGGVDPRILPGTQVWVYGREKLFGTIGAKPPHLQSAEESKKNYKREELFVDVGLPYEKVTELVKIGDLITFNTPVTSLKNNRVAVKTMDDRACIAIMLLAAEQLQNMRHDADVYFVSTCQEEVGSRGARTSAFHIDPDLAIGLDVCHATIPGSRPDTTSDLGSMVTANGPFLQPKLVKRLLDTAKKHNVSLQTEVDPGRTHTDCDELQVSRTGVPTVLLELPLKYMHTTVELIDLNVLEEGGRLLAHFLAELSAGWEDDLWI